MVESAVLVLFAAMLVGGVIAGVPLLALLALGLLLFCAYAVYRGHGIREIARMVLQGPRTAIPVLGMFVLIGALTASWRASGTIPAITCWSVQMVNPRTLIIASFLLCAAMSMLTGSSFAAAATVGVICVAIAGAMRADMALVGGAVLSGSFVGDRCSPLSSTANLVATLTHTHVFDNVRRMIRIGAIPFALSCVVYVTLGVSSGGTGMAPSFRGSFAASFDLSWVTILPTLVVLALSLARVNVTRTLLASLGCALAICALVQHMPLEQIPNMLVFGYHSQNLAIARMVNGGGIASMIDIILIVAMASTYAGIFEGTGLLLGLTEFVNRVARGATPFASVLVTSIVTCAVACDQVVALMLTAQLCADTERGGSALALDLENSAAIIPAVIPWSTSCIGIIAFVGMPLTSVAFNCLCYLIPLWTLAVSVYQHRHPAFVHGRCGRLLGLDARDDARDDASG